MTTGGVYCRPGSGSDSFRNELDIVRSGRVRLHKDGFRPAIFKVESVSNDTDRMGGDA